MSSPSARSSVPSGAMADVAAAPPLFLPLEALPVPLLCVELGAEPRLLAVNSRFRESFALPPQPQPRLTPWLALTYPNPDYRRRVEEQWHRAVLEASRGGRASLQCRLVSVDGEQREVLLLLSCQEERLLVAVQDVTARSRAEAQLEEAQASLARTALAITEAIPVGTYAMVMPPDRPVAYFSFLSERFLELTGLDRARARENPLEGFACVHPDDYDAWLRLNAEAFASKRPFKGECRVVLQGETRWVMAESVPRDLPDGSTVWEGVLSDITERVLAQQKLQASEQRLQRLLDNLPIPLLSLGADADTRPLLCNRRFVESFGYSLEALQDPQAWLEQAYPDPQQRALVQQSWHQALAASDTDGSLVSAGEFRLRCADGSERDVLISATRLDDLVVATLVDLSERKQAERALAAARERERQLEEQQRLRLEQKLRTSLTAAAVAHEINQPLSALLLQAKLAQARLAAIPAAGDSPPAPQPAPHSGDGIRPRSTAAGPDAGGDHAAEGNGAAGGRGAAAELATLLASLVRDAERVVQVIGKMRNLLRNVQTEPQPVDLATVVESALLFRRPRLQALGVVLHCRGLEHPCPISGDADQLQVAVSNLLRNALEALETVPAGNRSLEVALEPQGQRVLLRIGDSGGGFEAGVLADLPLATTKPDGTGLGLYVVQTTVDNHGGTLGFGRSPLGGALVELVLPAALPSERVPAPNGDGAGSGEAEPGVEVSAGDSSAPLRPIAQEQ